MTDVRKELDVKAASLTAGVTRSMGEGSSGKSNEESRPLFAAFAVLLFWLFLSASSFNLPGILLILSPFSLLLFVFLLVKGLVRREVRKELARRSA